MDLILKLITTVELLGLGKSLKVIFEWLRMSSPFPLWKEDPHFLEVFSQVESKTLVDGKRNFQFYRSYAMRTPT